MWFYEAMHETYLPLLQAVDRLDEDDISGSLTLSISAPLLAMMGDHLLRERFIAHLDRLIAFAEDELARTKGDEQRFELAQFYHDRFTGLRSYFIDELDGDLISAFARHSESGRFELMTCVGTHPILPFMATDAGRLAQVRVGIDHFRACFGHNPRGIWIAECAYTPGVGAYLAAEGIGFACLEDNAITDADAAPVYGNYAPIISKSGVAFFGRDQLASSQVWSADEGYPGDFYYREFYRDLGYDLPMEEVAPYIHPDGIRHNTGLKYHRITGDVALSDKKLYEPQKAIERAQAHAAHFVKSRQEQGEALSQAMGDRPAHITCPYDAELFGHWWFEGPHFLEYVFREAEKNKGVTLSTPAAYLDEVDVHQQTTPATSSWGEESYFSVWLDESNAWIYRHLRNAETKMVELVAQVEPDTELQKRALAQTARELVLAQSSDWPFIIKTGTTVEYAERRLRSHLNAFERLVEMLEDNKVDEKYLGEVEK
jgi:1,4-alpha-glucan branching enzyme